MEDNNFFIAIIGFGIVWCGVVYLAARKSGWSKLAVVYQCNKEFPSRYIKKNSRSHTLGMNGVTYRNITRIAADEQGFYLKVWFPLFRLFHPTLFIPWSEVKDEWHVYSLFQKEIARTIRLNFAREPRIYVEISKNMAKEMQMLTHREVFPKTLGQDLAEQ